MRHKTVGFVCNSLENVAGGLERQIIRTSKSFLSKGFKIYIFSFDNLSAKSFYEIPNEIKWIKCGGEIQSNKFVKTIRRINQILFLRKKLNHYKIKNLITFHHGIFPRVLVASLFYNIYNIVSERNSLSHYKYIKLSKTNLGFISLFFANKITVQLESYVNDYPFVLRKRITVISNILKKPLKNYKTPQLESNKVSMAGRLSLQKNFTPLLEQIKSESPKDIQFIIAGEGDLKSTFKENYSELIKNKTVVFKGNIRNMDFFLSQSAIFCFPSLWEGYPNSLAEALRLGLPIVTSKRMQYLVEFVEHEVNGLVVDDHKLLDSIKILLKDKYKLNFMSQQSFKKYEALNDSKPINDWINLVEDKY